MSEDKPFVPVESVRRNLAPVQEVTQGDKTIHISPVPPYGKVEATESVNMEVTHPDLFMQVVADEEGNK